MIVANNIQGFLNKKLGKDKQGRKDFIQGSGVSSSALSKLINVRQLNPSFITVLRIANYFQCSIDEVLGRKNYFIRKNKDHYLWTLDLNSINNNLKLFINTQLDVLNINVYTLEKNCGLGDSTIMHFIKENSNKKILSTPVIITLAEYFNISIDHMIGRIILVQKH